ncbi:MAG: hypothetical protein ACKVPJ_03725 [Chitinophagales bacterium]
MKKVSLLFTAAALTLFVASCSKEKTCECTTDITGFGSTTSEAVIQDGDCEDLNSSTTSFGITTTVDCNEK